MARAFPTSGKPGGPGMGTVFVVLMAILELHCLLELETKGIS